MDILFQKNKINVMQKINMMNFIDYDATFESIINTFIVSVDSKSDNEVRLLCFDEIDKWNKLYKVSKIKAKITSEKKPMTVNQIREYIQELDNDFYKTLQRLIDGEMLPNISRLIIMFFTNNGESIWDNIPDDLQSVKHRFTYFNFGYCNKKDVVAYLEMMYKRLSIKIDQNIYIPIPLNINISFRKLKSMIILCSYDIDEIISRLKSYVNDDFQFTKIGLKETDIEAISSESFRNYDKRNDVVTIMPSKPILQLPTTGNFSDIDSQFDYYKNNDKSIIVDDNLNIVKSVTTDWDTFKKSVNIAMYPTARVITNDCVYILHYDREDNIVMIEIKQDGKIRSKYEFRNNDLVCFEAWSVSGICKVLCVIYNSPTNYTEYVWDIDGQKRKMEIVTGISNRRLVEYKNNIITRDDVYKNDVLVKNNLAKN